MRNGDGEDTRLWIGLAKVKQKIGSHVLGEADEAYANVVGLATSKARFRKQVKIAVEDLELELLRLEGAEEFEDRISNVKTDKILMRLSKQVERNGAVAFGTFHAYDL